MVSPVSLEEVKDFGEEYGLLGHSSVYLLVDKEKRFYDYFGTKMIPSIFIYGKDKQLVKHFQGETKIEAILKYI